MASKKKSKSKKKSGKKFSGCKRVMICGNARKVCWRSGRIVSNKPWKKAG